MGSKGFHAQKIRRVVSVVVTTGALLGEGVSSAEQGRWEPIGPWGGGIEALVAHPATTGFFVVATSGAGIFRTTDGGVSWKPASRGLSLDDGVVTTLAVDERGIFFAGTSCCGVWKSEDGNRWVPANRGIEGVSVPMLVAGGGRVVAVVPVVSSTDHQLMYSEDGGASWQRSEGVPEAAFFSGLAMAPSNPNVLYGVISWSGLYRSQDGGSTWQRVSSPEFVIRTLLVDARDANVILVGSYGGVWRSSDGGQTWRRAFDGLEGQDVISLAQAWSQPNVFYAGTEGRVYKSTDGGLSWRRASLGLNAVYVKALAVDRVKSEMVLAGDWLFGLFRTTNGGQSWVSAMTGVAAARVSSVALVPGKPGSIFAGVSEKGVYRTVDHGRSWRLVLPSPISAWKVTAIVVDPLRSETVYAVLYPVGLWKSSDGGETWARIGAEWPLGSTEILLVDGRNPDRLVAVGTSAVFETRNGGLSWEELASLPRPPEWDDPWWSLSAAAFDPLDPWSLWVGSNSGQLFVSRDDGASWEEVVPRGALGGVRSLVPLAWPRGFLVVGTDAGIYTSSDVGRTWTRATVNVSGLESPYRVTLAVGADGTLWANCLKTYSSGCGVLRSTDGGRTWGAFDSGLVNRAVEALVADPNDPTRVLAATYGGGLFRLVLSRAPRAVLTQGSESHDGRMGNTEGLLPR